jgi:hypothetical protein
MRGSHRRIAMLVAVLGASLIVPGLSADDWMLPEPASFHARGMQLVAEVFPPASRQNSGTHALCYFYELGYPGTRWDVTPTLKWKAELANERMPIEAIVSQDGWLVTMNEWYGAGRAHSLVVYDPRGHLVADWSGDRLFADPALKQIAHDRTSMSSVWWNQHARYHFTRQRVLFVTLSADAVIRVDLAAGRYRVGAASAFRDYAEAAADANALTDIWKTSLRFSSITDVLAARAARSR